MTMILYPKLTEIGKKCRNGKKGNAGDRSKLTLRFSSRAKSLLKEFVKRYPVLIEQTKITDFVTAVETKKKFKAEPDKVFRHLVSEIGELDSAMYEVDKLSKMDDTQELPASNVQALRTFFSKKVGEEILDIIFLSCYMAKIYGVDLNELAPARMEAIKREYGVEWPKKGRKNARY